MATRASRLLATPKQKSSPIPIPGSRAIPGWSGYYADPDGNIWSTRRGEWRLLNPTKRYHQAPPPGRVLILVVGLCGGPGIRKCDAVGRLVLSAFVGPCPEGMECCHFDGDPTNNRPSNLRWDTRQGNVNDMVRHGRLKRRAPFGESHLKAVLRETDVRLIFELKKAGHSNRALAARFGVKHSTIWNIWHRRIWKHLAL